MKILIVCNDMKNGGVERVLSVLANYFANKGNKVRMLAIRTKNVSYALSDEVEYDFIPLRSEDGDESIKQEMHMLKELFKYIRVYKPDVLLGFDDSIIVRTVPLAWIQGIKSVVSERIDPSIYGRAMRFVRQIAYDMAKKVVFQTEEAKSFFPKRTQKKSVVIPNPLSDNLPERKAKTNKDILMACRISPQKNIGLAIDAFNIFFKNHNDYRLVIYGEGELLGEMREKANKLGLSDSVVFPGHVDDIHERMSECAMYLSSSDYEGISNSMLEALAIGAPCICTDCPVGGAKMFIDSMNNGILVPVGDAEKMAEAMGLIANDDELARRISTNSIKIKQLLSTSTICPQWEELIN